MKKKYIAQVIERRGRITRIKFPDGLICSIPNIDYPIGSNIYLDVETKE